MTDRLFKCRAFYDGKIRCQFEGDNDAAGEHWRETGHARCVCCSRFLANDETLTCLKCVARTRAAITSVVDAVALAPDVIEGNGYRGILWDLLAAISDGSIESPVQSAHPDRYVYLNSKGRNVPLEEATDPWPVVAVLYGIERSWREELGHAPRMLDATVTGCAGYLNEWLPDAAARFAGFDGDAATLRTLASRLTHMAGTADDPVRGVSCLDRLDADSRCDGTLVRVYRQPVTVVPERGRTGKDREGLDDQWACNRCKREYDHASYYLAVKAALESEAQTA